MDGNSNQTESVTGRRTYAAPVLQRLGTLEELTRTVGHGGAKDGQQTGNQKRTSL